MWPLRTFCYMGKVSTTFRSGDIEILCNFLLAEAKICFSTISLKISTFGHMLLHKSYINVAIANILLYRKSLYDLQKRRYDLQHLRLRARNFKRDFRHVGHHLRMGNQKIRIQHPRIDQEPLRNCVDNRVHTYLTQLLYYYCKDAQYITRFQRNLQN